MGQRDPLGRLVEPELYRIMASSLALAPSPGAWVGKGEAASRAAA